MTSIHGSRPDDYYNLEVRKPCFCMSSCLKEKVSAAWGSECNYDSKIMWSDSCVVYKVNTICCYYNSECNEESFSVIGSPRNRQKKKYKEGCRILILMNNRWACAVSVELSISNILERWKWLSKETSHVRSVSISWSTWRKWSRPHWQVSESL